MNKGLIIEDIFFSGKLINKGSIEDVSGIKSKQVVKAKSKIDLESTIQGGMVKYGLELTEDFLYGKLERESVGIREDEMFIYGQRHVNFDPFFVDKKLYKKEYHKEHIYKGNVLEYSLNIMLADIIARLNVNDTIGDLDNSLIINDLNTDPSAELIGERIYHYTGRRLKKDYLLTEVDINNDLITNQVDKTITSIQYDSEHNRYKGFKKYPVRRRLLS